MLRRRIASDERARPLGWRAGFAAHGLGMGLGMLLSVVLGSVCVAQGLEPLAERALIGWQVEDATGEPVSEPFVGQPVRLRLRFGLERSFAGEGLVPLLLRPLDLPVLVVASELEYPRRGGRGADPQPDGAQRRSFALGDSVAYAQVLDEPGDFELYALDSVRRFERPGRVLIEAAQLRFAYAEGFEDDLVRGRVPTERRESVVRGAPLELRVRALPESERPADFSGAVGRFALRTELEPRDIDVGASVTLRVRVEALAGLGEPASGTAPRLRSEPGWRVQGQLDESEGATRTFTWDLVCESPGMRAAPRVRFVSFDPWAERYVALESEPLELRALAVDRSGAQATPTPGAGVDSAESRSAQAGDPATPTWLERGRALVAARPRLTLACLALPWLVWGLALYSRVHRRRRRDGAVPGRVDPGRRAELRRARSELASLLGEQRGALDDEQRERLVQAFGAYLAARLGRTPTAVVGVDLAGPLAAAGVEGELAERTAGYFAELVGERYGGPRPSAALERARQLFEGLDRKR